MVHGLKSFASKLHPELPLSPRESNRLLTALTGSFRRQLDEAHPPAKERAQPSATRRDDASTTPGPHSSSAAIADRHLASVLTSSLFSDPRPPKLFSLANAKADLTNNPDRDPISLFEEWHKNGHATAQIASFCLQACNRSIAALSPTERRVALQRSLAGSRVLRCVQDSQLYHSDFFINDKGFCRDLVNSVTQEGAEEKLWAWLQEAGTGNGPLNAPSARASGNPNHWKAIVLRFIVSQKLSGPPPAHVNAAIDSFLRAFALTRDEHQAPTNPTSIPLAKAGLWLLRALARSEVASHADPARFDRVIATAAAWFPSAHAVRLQWHLSFLWLVHPQRPSPHAALELIQTLAERPGSADAAALLPLLQRPPTALARGAHYRWMISTAALLDLQGASREAACVVAFAKSIEPGKADVVERDWEQHRRAMRLKGQGQEPLGERKDVSRPSFPSFAFNPG